MRRNAVLATGLILAASTFSLAARLSEADPVRFAQPYKAENFCRTYLGTCGNTLQSAPSTERRIFVCYCGDEIAELVVGIQNLGQIYKEDLGRYLVPLSKGSQVAGRSVNYFLVENFRTAARLTTKNFSLVPATSIQGWQDIPVTASQTINAQLIGNYPKIAVILRGP